MTKVMCAAAAVVAAGVLAGCSGGGGSSSSAPAAPRPTPAPTQMQSTAQVISLALPTTAIGRETDPTFGAVAGFTQTQFSQVLGFAPGSQVMIRNGESTRPHTLGDTGGTTGFPNNPPLTLASSGSSTIGSGFQSGTINPNQLIGPFTLAAGTYYIGCAYHYTSDGMRDVLVVSAAATPGPAATPPPGAATPPPAPGGGYGY